MAERLSLPGVGVRKKTLREGVVELLLGLLLGDADGEGQLGDEDLTSLGEHALLAGRQAFVLVANRQVPHDLRDLVDVARLELLDVVLEPARPVGGHPRLLLAKDGEDLLDLLVVDDLPEPYLLGVVARDHEREVAVGELEHEVFAVFAEHIALLPALDDGCAVMRIHDLVSDVEGHTSPRDVTAGVQIQSARKRLLGQLGRRFLPAIVSRVVDPTLLSRTPFFAGLDAAAVETVAGLCVRRELKRNDVLFREGEDATELFVVERGRVAIANRSDDGRESLVALMEAGDLFGEMGLFDGVRSADARALETSTVVAVPYGPLREALDRQPSALWSVVELLARRIRAVDEALADTVCLDAPGRTDKRRLERAVG